MTEFVYLDNAATTWPKPEAVHEAIDACMKMSAANPGRSSHRMSVAAQKVVDDARIAVMSLFSAPTPENVVFTLNCTDSLNMAIKGLAKQDSRIVVGVYEHNSVMRPLSRLEKSGVKLLRTRRRSDFTIDLEHLENICRDGIDLAVISHASNVTGIVESIQEIARIVHRYGGVLLVDAAQTAGVVDIDMVRMGIDVLASAGHKSLYGPMGVGILVLARDLGIRPLREGGTGFRSEDITHPLSLPWSLEAGTPNLPGIAGLAAGIKFVKETGIKKIQDHETGLASSLVAGLAEIPCVRVFCRTSAPETGVVSFTVDGVDPAVAGVALDQRFDIAVRTGLHCAPWAHRALGTLDCGTVRASTGYFNTTEHVERLVAATRVLSREYAF